MSTRTNRRQQALDLVQPFLDEWLERVPSHSAAFRNWAVEQLLWDFDLSREEIEATITDGSGDMGIDAWFFSRDQEPKTLYLIQSKDTRAERTDLTRLREGLLGLFDPLRIGEGNQEVRGRAAEFAH